LEVLASAKSSGSVSIPLFFIAIFAVFVVIGIRTAIDQRRPKNHGASFSPREIRSPLDGISKGAFPALGRVKFGAVWNGTVGVLVLSVVALVIAGGAGSLVTLVVLESALIARARRIALVIDPDAQLVTVINFFATHKIRFQDIAGCELKVSMEGSRLATAPSLPGINVRNDRLILVAAGKAASRDSGLWSSLSTLATALGVPSDF
jgi:hypothetical protein